jgi:hypothetical protein
MTVIREVRAVKKESREKEPGIAFVKNVGH